MTKLGTLLASFVGLLIFLFPESAFAWGPATHLVYANDLLNNLNLIPPLLQQLLLLHREDFLYGNLAADITLGKKYIEYEHHCHNWRVGFEILNKAPNEKLKAFAYGYLCHLAADTISHNYFVPFKTVESYKGTIIHRHTYWELRFDAAIAEKSVWKNAFNITKERRHKDCDKHLDKILHQTLFTFNTNRRIFHGLMTLQSLVGYQKTILRAHGRSKIALPTSEVKEIYDLTKNTILDFMKNGSEASICKLDPSGEKNLKRAAKMRRELKKLARKKNGTILCAEKISQFRQELKEQFKLKS